MYLCSMLLKTSCFYCFTWRSPISEIFILKIEMLLVFQNKTNIEIIGFQLMYVGFTLDSSDVDLWNIDLLGTHLDLLETDIPSKHFAFLQDILKTSLKHVLKASSRHVFKTCSRYFFNTTSRHVQDVFETSSA